MPCGVRKAGAFFVTNSYLKGAHVIRRRAANDKGTHLVIGWQKRRANGIAGFFMRVNKEQLRRQILLGKQRLTAQDILRQSRRVARHLKRSRLYREAQTILFYSPLAREVQIQPLLRKALKDGKRICLPACQSGSKRMRPYVIHFLHELVPGPYGILQPRQRKARLQRPGQIDVALVPAMALDRKGNRLGRGKGFYDRFLRHWGRKAIKVGVVFRQQIVSRVPVGPKDVPMDFVANPSGIFSCNKG